MEQPEGFSYGMNRVCELQRKGSTAKIRHSGKYKTSLFVFMDISLIINGSVILTMVSEETSIIIYNDW